MKSRRPISINNSLAHGICNYHCRLCGIKKGGYDGPREFQPYIITSTLIKRIQEAAHSGINIRYIANSGDGESTLHPEFIDRMKMFGRMLKRWDVNNMAKPEVSVVTNGSRLNQVGIMEAFIENNLTMIISLPTLTPDSYGLIMANNPKRGHDLLANVLPSVGIAMLHRAKNNLSNLYFHISPPETDIIRHDFPQTINRLVRLAADNRLNKLQIIMFPAPSNRSGLVQNTATRVDMYKDLFKRYHDTTINGVSIQMKLVLHRFFASITEIGDLIRSFNFPCLWNANFFITSDGSSICCNDQSVQHVQGNIITSSFDSLMRAKETFRQNSVCKNCNQSPQNIQGSLGARIFSLLVKARIGYCSKINSITLFNKYFTGSKETLPIEEEGGDQVAKEMNGGFVLNKNEQEPVNRTKLVENVWELEEAFRLVYHKYSDAGFQDHDPSMMRINLYNLLPTSHMLVHREENKINGTLSLIRECHGKLPMNELFEDDLEPLRQKDLIICELSGLAIDSPSFLKSKSILLSLFQSAFILGHFLLDCTDFCMMVNPDHCKYYEDEFKFNRIGKVKEYSKVNGALAVPLHLDLTVAIATVQKKAPRLFHTFLGDHILSIEQQLKSELLHQKKLFTDQTVDRLLQKKSDLLENLTIDEKKLLYRYYPALLMGEMASLQGERLVGQKRQQLVAD